MIELFDPGRWPVWFHRPSLDEARFWPAIEFIQLISHPPCSILWFLLLYTCLVYITLSSLWNCYQVKNRERITVAEFNITVFIVAGLNHPLSFILIRHCGLILSLLQIDCFLVFCFVFLFFFFCGGRFYVLPVWDSQINFFFIES